MNDLRVALLQTALHWEDPAANIQHMERAMNELAGPVDVIILPETWATGFTMNPIVHGIEWSPYLEQQPSNWPAPLSAMLRWARMHQSAIVGSLACSLTPDNRHVNRCFFITPEGRISFYDKKHLFTFHGEHQWYSAGEDRTVVEWRGWQILLQICYDLRFPVFSRNRPGAPYDLAIYVANWPAVRSDAWSKLLPARAIENLAYVAGVNRIGSDGNGVEHDGRSALLNPYGQTIGSLEPDESGWITGLCSREEIERLRSRFPALDDADEFVLTV